jgi:hypothetical protein
MLFQAIFPRHTLDQESIMNAANPFQNPITRRSLDQLETDLISLSSLINAHEYEFLVLLREFDLRRGWKAYHFNHCSNGSRCCG